MLYSGGRREQQPSPATSAVVRRRPRMPQRRHRHGVTQQNAIYITLLCIRGGGGLVTRAVRMPTANHERARREKKIV